jgi:hypothetical protein
MVQPRKTDVERAITELRHIGVPKEHRSGGYCLIETTGLHLPPKLVLSKAIGAKPDKFSGGKPTNSRLEKLGYRIEKCSCGGEGAVRSGNWKLSWRVPVDKGMAKIGRIIVDHAYKSEHAPEILDAVANTWPKGHRTKYLIGCGGFILAEWPKAVQVDEIENAPQSAIDALADLAKVAASQILTLDRRQSLAQHFDYFSLGVDFYTDLDRSAACPEDLAKPHVEFVGMLNLRSGKWTAWTGKFYPVPNQQRQLLRVTDLKSHFTSAGKDRVLLLGCNDLTMWNTHGAANLKRGSLRDKWRREMMGVAVAAKPTVVLHHPHRTQSARVWCQSWAELNRKLPTVADWASALRFSTLDCRKPTRSLESVLKATRGSDTLDVVVTRS